MPPRFNASRSLRAYRTARLAHSLTIRLSPVSDGRRVFLRFHRSRFRFGSAPATEDAHQIAFVFTPRNCVRVSGSSSAGCHPPGYRKSAAAGFARRLGISSVASLSCSIRARHAAAASLLMRVLLLILVRRGPRPCLISRYNRLLLMRCAAQNSLTVENIVRGSIGHPKIETANCGTCVTSSLQSVANSGIFLLRTQAREQPGTSTLMQASCKLAPHSPDKHALTRDALRQ